jgi:Arylsulfatase A and related enzymes
MTSRKLHHVASAFRRKVAASAICVALACVCFEAPPQAQPSKPNILLIQADDLGYGDVSVYGQAMFQTPNVDRLARNGLRFISYYAGSTVCAPSRAALMTGLHTGHTSIRGNLAGNSLRAEDRTIAMVLKDAGYRTAMIGKWGLGESESPGRPDRKGFEHYFGYLSQTHAHRQFTDHLYRDGQRVDVKEGEYSNDLFSRDALSFIEQSDNRPFFIYLNYTVPHAELRVPDDSMAPFRGRFPEKAFVNAAADAKLTALTNHHSAIALSLRRMRRSPG